MGELDDFVDDGLNEAGFEGNVESDVDADTMPSNDPAANVPADGGTQQVVVETEPESKTEEKPAQEAKPQRERLVPVSVVQSLRAKNRDLRGQLEERAPFPSAARGDVVLEPEVLKGKEDDDYLTAGETRALLAEITKTTDSKVSGVVANQSRAQFEQRAEIGENALRTKLADMPHDLLPDVVFQYDLDNGILDASDVQAIQRAADPAQAMYDRIIAKSPDLFAKKVMHISTGGSKSKTSAKTTTGTPAAQVNSAVQGATKDETELSDEEFLDEIFPDAEA